MEAFPFSKKRQGGGGRNVGKREEGKKGDEREKGARVQEQTRGDVAVGDVRGKIGKVGGEGKDDEEMKGES